MRIYIRECCFFSLFRIVHYTVDLLFSKRARNYTRLRQLSQTISRTVGDAVRMNTTDKFYKIMLLGKMLKKKKKKRLKCLVLIFK